MEGVSRLIRWEFLVLVGGVSGCVWKAFLVSGGALGNTTPTASFRYCTQAPDISCFSHCDQFHMSNQLIVKRQ